MNELQIKTEYMPVRCDICHQTDCFDAERNYCSRCADAVKIAATFDARQKRLVMRPDSIIRRNIIIGWTYRGLVGGAIAGGGLAGLGGFVYGLMSGGGIFAALMMLYLGVTYGAMIVGYSAAMIGAFIGLIIWLTRSIKVWRNSRLKTAETNKLEAGN